MEVELLGEVVKRQVFRIVFFDDGSQLLDPRIHVHDRLAMHTVKQPVENEFEQCTGMDHIKRLFIHPHVVELPDVGKDLLGDQFLRYDAKRKPDMIVRFGPEKLKGYACMGDSLHVWASRTLPRNVHQVARLNCKFLPSM